MRRLDLVSTNRSKSAVKCLDFRFEALKVRHSIAQRGRAGSADDMNYSAEGARYHQEAMSHFQRFLIVFCINPARCAGLLDVAPLARYLERDFLVLLRVAFG
jgi:hypothetical protein